MNIGIPKVTAIQSPMENPFTKMFAKESSNDTNKVCIMNSHLKEEAM